jgi:tRNA threonylcarbamoyladenosine biosynthesis protein TsaE
LGRELSPDGTLLLQGDLGTGKTVLTRGIAAALGISPDAIQSPTFTLVREHRGEIGALLHLDLYRLEPQDTEALGLEEIFAAEAVKVVEWAERLPWIPEDAVTLRLRRLAGEAEERELEELKEDS